MVSFSLSPSKKMKKAPRKQLAAFALASDPQEGPVRAAGPRGQRTVAGGSAAPGGDHGPASVAMAVDEGTESQWKRFADRAVVHACRGEFQRSATLFATSVRLVSPMLPATREAPPPADEDVGAGPRRQPPSAERPKPPSAVDASAAAAPAADGGSAEQKGGAGAALSAADAATRSPTTDPPLDQNGEPRPYGVCGVQAPTPKSPGGDSGDGPIPFEGQIDLLAAAKVFEQYAQVLMELGQYPRAVRIAMRAVELAPQWAVAHQTLYRAQLNEGNPHGARQSAASAMMHASDDTMMEEMRREKNEIEQICTKFDNDQKNNEEALEVEQRRAVQKAQEERRVAIDRAAENEREAEQIRSGLKDVFSATRLNHNTTVPTVAGANTCTWDAPEATFESCQEVAKKERAKHAQKRREAGDDGSTENETSSNTMQWGPPANHA